MSRCNNKYAAFKAAVVFLTALSCSPKAPNMILDDSATANAEAEAIYQESCARFNKGDIGSADEGFARIIREFPTDPLSRAATIYRARIALSLDNPQRARALLSPLKGKTGPVKGNMDPIAERALLYDGAALQQLGENAEAIRTLEPLVDRMTDQEDIRVLETTLWNAARAGNDMERAAAAVDRLLANSNDPNERRDVLQAYKKTLVSITDISLLERLATSLPNTSRARPAIEGRIAELHLEAGHFEKAAEILERLEQKIGEVPEDETPIPAARPENVDLNAVGLLVPLSGRARLVGDAAVKGAMLGAKETGIRLVVRDSKSSPEDAAFAVEELVSKDRVAAIIGPLDSTEAAAAAQKAESLKVPILVMSVKEEVSAGGDYVFREFSGNRAEPAALVEISKARGGQKYGVLFPDTGYGRTMRAFFTASIKAAGLLPAAESSYTEDAVNFKEQAESLAQQDIDVLFLPDQASRIALIAPALAAAGLWSTPSGRPPTGEGRPVQLIIPSMGFSEDLIRRAGRYLNGALFSTFFAPEVHPASQSFASRYHLEYGMRPNVVAAYGHDAVLILGEALKSNVETRSDIRQWLIESASSEASAVHTATPFSGFTSNGAPKALPFVLELLESRLSIVDLSAGTAASE